MFAALKAASMQLKYTSIGTINVVAYLLRVIFFLKSAHASNLVQNFNLFKGLFKKGTFANQSACQFKIDFIADSSNHFFERKFARRL